MKRAAEYEKHHTEDGKGTSIFMRLFALKYINTSFVFFISNGNVADAVLGTHKTKWGVFSEEWFNNTGVFVMLVQLGDIVASHAFKCVQYFLHKRRKSTGIYVSQDELNRSYLGPHFELAFNYAQLMSTFFCCFTFSTGIPILYAFSAANFGLYYLVEKYLFINFYRIPPHFSNIVGMNATALVPYSLAIHLAMSIWVLSNDLIFNNKEQSSNAFAGWIASSGSDPWWQSFSQTLAGEATFPLFVYLLVILVIGVAISIYVRFEKEIQRAVSLRSVVHDIVPHVG